MLPGPAGAQPVEGQAAGVAAGDRPLPPRVARPADGAAGHGGRGGAGPVQRLRGRLLQLGHDLRPHQVLEAVRKRVQVVQGQTAAHDTRHEGRERDREAQSDHFVAASGEDCEPRDFPQTEQTDRVAEQGRKPDEASAPQASEHSAELQRVTFVQIPPGSGGAAQDVPLPENPADRLPAPREDLHRGGAGGLPQPQRRV